MNRIEVLSNELFRVEDKIKVATYASDRYALPTLRRLRGELHREVTWLKAIDNALAFPHEWADYKVEYRRVIIWLATPAAVVTTPLNSVIGLERGVLRWEYDEQFAPDIPPARIADFVNHQFFSYHEKLWTWMKTVKQANNLLPWLSSPPAKDNLRILLAKSEYGLPWAIVKRDAHAWLIHDAMRVGAIELEVQRAGDNLELLALLIALALHTGKAQIDWKPW